ncbi:alkaline phosphatase family protein [Arthrobacter sp. H20]|uniref:alkaline phosphatase family protein n=1 Tax=Arthrobacter sp. H20 TaxID=1267981 RepID=UPI0004BB5D32|nr:alkaline phosphatase family protein [Arthrobacter sp. H20]
MIGHREPLPAAPPYGRSSVAEVFTSAAAALGLDSSLGPFVNALGLPRASRVCVVVVDGLGSALLKRRGGHAPFLRSHLDGARIIGSAFPSTTAASLGSLGTGLSPGMHGLVGYDVLDPEQGKVVNMLGGWDPGVDPLRWQPYPSVFEQTAGQIPVTSVSLPKFADSAMTRAALRGGNYLAAGTLQARVRGAHEQLADSKQALVYLYLNEMDKAGHRYGCGSAEWGAQLEDVDSAIKTLAARVPSDTLLLLTADHGMVDVDVAHRYDFSTEPALIDGLAHTAGEPRMLHLYYEPGLSARGRELLISAWQDAYGQFAWIFTRDQAMGAGLFGDVDPRVLPRIGDLMVAAREPIALYDRRRTSASAMEVVGQHGSLTRAEREVPLLTLNRPGGKVPRG